MMKEEDKEKSQENKSSDKPIEDQPQAQQPSEAGESAAKESTEDKLKEVSAKLMSDVSSVWGQALGEAGESLSCKRFLIAEMNQFFFIFEFAKTKYFVRHCLFSDKSGSSFFIHSLLLQKNSQALQSFRENGDRKGGAKRAREAGYSNCY
jgi:hypothetical protein